MNLAASSELKLSLHLNHSGGDIASLPGTQDARGRLLRKRDHREKRVMDVVSRKGEIMMVEEVEELETDTQYPLFQELVSLRGELATTLLAGLPPQLASTITGAMAMTERTLRTKRFMMPPPKPSCCAARAIPIKFVDFTTSPLFVSQ